MRVERAAVDGQRGDDVHHLALHAQRLPARAQHAEVLGVRQQDEEELTDVLAQVLAVVEEQQHVLGRQPLGELLRRTLAAR